MIVCVYAGKRPLSVPMEYCNEFVNCIKELDSDVYARQMIHSSSWVHTYLMQGQDVLHRMTEFNQQLTDELRLNNSKCVVNTIIHSLERIEVLFAWWAITANAAYWFHGANEGKMELQSSLLMEHTTKMGGRF